MDERGEKKRVKKEKTGKMNDKKLSDSLEWNMIRKDEKKENKMINEREEIEEKRRKKTKNEKKKERKKKK